MHDYLALHPEVADALEDKQPVVALESTAVAHGMTYPRNVEAARSVEAIVRAGGAVPATIAVLDGRIRVGLDDDDLHRLGAGPELLKISRRDLPVALARESDGSATVAAAVFCAGLVGIPVFATGALGGVHRGAETSFDISADLDEIARTAVAVICAGIPGGLDAAKTLEYLETRGVPVLGWRTHEFPAFLTRSSGIDLPYRVEEAAEAARIMRTQWQLGLSGGLVIACPIPETASDPALIDPAIARALDEAGAEGIAGPALTPFLLGRVGALTAGASLTATIAAVEESARVGADIAECYSLLATAQRPVPRARPRVIS